MRKNQLQQFSLKSLIVLGLLLLVFTCQKEDDLIEEEKHTAQIKSQNFTATVFRKSSVINTTPKLKQHIDKILSKENNSTKRTITSQEYGFSIDTTKILQLQSDYYTSYIFIVERENQQEFVLENYIITQFADNTIKQYLVNYPIHTDGSLDIAMAQLEGLEGQGLYLREGTTCYTFEEYEEPSYNNIPCHGQGASGEHTVEDGDECDYWGNPNQMATVEYVPGGWISHEDCISGGGSGGGITDPISGGGTVDPTDYDQPVIPVFKYTWEKIELCINGGDISPSSPLYGQLPEDGVTIEPGLIASLNLPEETLLAIDSYLIANNCSEEAQEFTVEAMQAFMDGGEVDFENKVFKDISFKDTEIECIHDKLLADNQTNFYKIMIEAFSNNSFENLRFEIGSTSNGDWGISAGNVNNTTVFGGFDFYNITIDNDIENSSNISQMVTLCHELIHVYMFNSLDNLGVIIYDTDGAPLFDTAQCVNYQPNININNLSMKDRWVALICAYNTNNPNSQDWTHHLFNTANFVVDSYKSQLESFILNNHDWDNEPLFLKTELQTHFGNQWKEKASEFISWRGLEKTDAFIVWAQNNNINSTLNSNGEIQDVFYNGIISSLKDYGKSDCL